jgi:DNA-directed RNA polymerase specialized sigma24 family protein
MPERELREVEKAVLNLRDLLGLSFEEIGIRIGRTAIAARALYQKAQRKLTHPKYRDDGHA